MQAIHFQIPVDNKLMELFYIIPVYIFESLETIWTDCLSVTNTIRVLIVINSAILTSK